MASVSLDGVLLHGIRTIWPRRSQRELLFDLGERKGWTEEVFEEAVARAADWMVRELLLPIEVQVGRGVAPDLSRLRIIGADLTEGPTGSSVAKWIRGIAPAAGSSPKTLANSLRTGLRSDRPDHRWLAAIARIAAPPSDDFTVDAWLFHRRSPTSVGQALSQIGGRTVLDTGDALLLFSLIALWQRRRPTERVRGNKGQERSRRETPKPVAALGGAIASLGQFGHLMRVADVLGDPGPLRLLTLEAALTEAHLGPHRARRSQGEPLETGESWLNTVSRVIEAPDYCAADERAAFAFRVERMRAWRDSRAMEPLHDTPDIPYVRATMALERTRRHDAPSETFPASDEGLLMLLPLLRSRGLEIRP